MTIQRYFSTAAVCLAIFCLTITAWAQFPMGNQPSGAVPPYPAISASGTSTIKRLPDTIRVIIPLQAKGKTIDEAFANLKTEQQTALEKIQKIGAKQENIKFESFSIDQSQKDKQRQIEMMIAQRMPTPTSTPRQTAAVALPTTLKCMLLAEWPITGTAAEDILKESYELKQQIDAADFSPQKNELTPEEEELEEEMEAMDYRRSYDSESGNEPQFLFVSGVTEKESQKAYSEAFEQAQKQGEFLAQAIGFKRGTLMQLSANLIKRQGGLNPYRSNDNYYVMQMMQSQQIDMGTSAQLECISMTPDAVEFVFVVQTVFMIEK